MTQTLLPFAPERTPQNVDRSFAEIGRILGISKQHAQRLHDQAMAKIRPVLAEMPDVLAYLEGRD